VSLIVPRSPCLTFAASNLLSNASTTTAVTFGSSNADGAATTLLSALAQDAHMLVVKFAGTNLAEENNALADILIDPAGGTSWANFIDDLVCGFAQQSSTSGQDVGIGCIYKFPIWIPAGASIGFQGRRAGATADPSGGAVQIAVFGKPTNPSMYWCGQRVESLGINAASSRGATVTPSATTNTFGAWTAIGTSTRRYGALNFGVNGPNAATVTVQAMNWEIGDNSTRRGGTPTFRTMSDISGTAVMRRVGFDLMHVDIPSGTALQARCKAVGTAGQAWNAALYGVY
jgi:hypothetical protein